jgi:hypothetical protein
MKKLFGKVVLVLPKAKDMSPFGKSFEGQQLPENPWAKTAQPDCLKLAKIQELNTIPAVYPKIQMLKCSTPFSKSSLAKSLYNETPKNPFLPTI